MKLAPRAAIVAAVTMCIGAMANAATLDLQAMQEVPVQGVNARNQLVVPPPEKTTPAIVFAKPAEIVQQLPQEERAEPRTDNQEFETLSAAVAAQDPSVELDRELHCLAVGVYYEAKGEPLAGQLAVAEVILNRTTSGRFPRSVCSVLTQRGQFSFVRGGRIPAPPQNAQWRKALAVAKVAQKDLWDSPADEALYFHASHVRPGWKRTRVASLGNHVFYR